MGWKHEGHSCLFCWFRARNRNFSPTTTPFLFANDVEIENHFVFSVIMNIWCMPSGLVVFWWAWPWLLVKKRDINVQAGSDWAIFGKISDAQAQAVLCYMNEYFLYFCLVVWTLQKQLGFVWQRNKWGKALMSHRKLYDVDFKPLRDIFSGTTPVRISQPCPLTNATLYPNTVGSGQGDDDAREREGWDVWET